MAQLSWCLALLLACGDDAAPSGPDETRAEIVDEAISETSDTLADAPPEAAPETVAEARDAPDLPEIIDTSDSSDTADGELTPSPVMRVHVLDLGQGEALIIELPCGAMLVDTGGEVTAAGAPGGGFDSDLALESQSRDFFEGRPDLDDTFDLQDADRGPRRDLVQRWPR